MFLLLSIPYVFVITKTTKYYYLVCVDAERGHVIEESVMCGGDKRETNISTSTGHNLLTGNTQ